MRFLPVQLFAAVALLQGTVGGADLKGVADKLEAEDFRQRESAVAEMATLADSDLDGVIRFLADGTMGPEATARIPKILHQIFLRQCYHLGEPETGMRLRLYVEGNSTSGVTAAHPLIEDLAKDSPASKAGLRKGDVIVKWQGEALEGHDSLVRLRQMLRTASEGAKVKVQVRRFEPEGYARLKGDGKLQEPVEMTLGAPLGEPPEKVIEKSYLGWLDRMRMEHGLPAKYAVPQS